MMEEQRWRRAQNWVAADFEDGVVMIDVELGSYVGLNDTATTVWEALEKPASRDDVVGLLRTRFDIGHDECVSAVTRTLDRFCAVGLAAPA